MGEFPSVPVTKYNQITYKFTYTLNTFLKHNVQEEPLRGVFLIKKN